MVIVMKERATDAQIDAVVGRLREMGFDIHRSTGESHTVIGAVGHGDLDPQLIAIQDGVQEVHRTLLHVICDLVERAFLAG